MKRMASHRRRAGVASFFAVASLGLVATAILAMTTTLRIDHRRTQAAAVDAQLRQLLLAAAVATEQRLESAAGHDPAGVMELPEGLTQAGAAVRWEPTESERVERRADGRWMTVIAEYAGASAHQHLRFVPDENHGGYRIAEALTGPR
ncbi:MAG: hypothetical protein AAF800_07250 [Planctomycetota bacterium]